MAARHADVQRVLRSAQANVAEIHNRLTQLNVGGVDYKTLGQIVAVDGLLRDAKGILPKNKAPKRPQTG